MADRSIPTPATCPELRRVTRNVAPLPLSPPCTRGDAHPATHAEAASVRASLVSGAACMGPQHPVQSPLNPNLTVASRKRRGPLDSSASSEPSCPPKWQLYGTRPEPPLWRGTSEQMSAFSLYKPPFGGGPPSEPKFFASSEPKLFYKLTSVWEQATAPAARTNVNFPRSQIASNLLGATRQPTDEEGAGGLPLHPHARHLPRASRDYTEGWHPRGRGDASTRNFAVDDSIGAS